MLGLRRQTFTYKLRRFEIEHPVLDQMDEDDVS
jgi:hypothetical protein